MTIRRYAIVAVRHALAAAALSQSANPWQLPSPVTAARSQRPGVVRLTRESLSRTLNEPHVVQRPGDTSHLLTTSIVIRVRPRTPVTPLRGNFGYGVSAASTAATKRSWAQALGWRVRPSRAITTPYDGTTVTNCASWPTA